MKKMRKSKSIFFINRTKLFLKSKEKKIYMMKHDDSMPESLSEKKMNTIIILTGNTHSYRKTRKICEIE